MKLARLTPLALLGLAACVAVDAQDRSDAGRRHSLAGHWYDQYMQGMSYAQGDTDYRRDGTFTAEYESVAPGTTTEPLRRETVHWAGKWRVENGQLIEDITSTSDASRTPADRPLIRSIATLDATHLLLRNGNGNINAYARKRPAAPKVTYTPSSG